MQNIICPYCNMDLPIDTYKKEVSEYDLKEIWEWHLGGHITKGSNSTSLEKTMEQLIEIAIKGGFIPKYYSTRTAPIRAQDVYKLYLMDKEFFQALGKECGWKDESVLIFRNFEGEYLDGVCSCCTGYDKVYIPTWKAEALIAYEINLTESFDSAISYLLGLCEVKK